MIFKNVKCAQNIKWPSQGYATSRSFLIEYVNLSTCPISIYGQLFCDHHFNMTRVI